MFPEDDRFPSEQLKWCSFLLEDGTPRLFAGSASQLANHERLKHGKRIYYRDVITNNVCPLCRVVFVDREKTIQHVRSTLARHRCPPHRVSKWGMLNTKMPVACIKCPLCDADFAGLSSDKKLDHMAWHIRMKIASQRRGSIAYYLNTPLESTSQCSQPSYSNLPHDVVCLSPNGQQAREDGH